jgi:hypothetical protein
MSLIIEYKQQVAPASNCDAIKTIEWEDADDTPALFATDEIFKDLSILALKYGTFGGSALTDDLNRLMEKYLHWKQL